MRNARIFFIVMFMAAALLLGAGCGSNSSAKPDAEQSPTAIDDTSEGGVVEEGLMPDEAGSPKNYTLEEIAAHNTPEDCWFAIHGKVYDVSGYASKHPGGEAVYAGCGLDATELFETRSMGSGTPHSDKARGFMENFEIGVTETQ